MKNRNTIWDFFASVKLALFTLFFLATTSVIGTIIPQKETAQWYIDRYGEASANLFQILSITPDMYSSGWFLSLLGLLCINLIICSLDRFPGVWHQIKADNLATPLTRLEKMTPQSQWQSANPPTSSASALKTALNTHGWKAKERSLDNGILLFAQKGAMTRTGVYIVHVSILVIFAGAIIGSALGFKASVMLPETRTTDKVYTFDTNTAIDLGFEVRCDRFNIEFYDNGMPKAYRSHLSILEDGKVVTEKAIVVNDPLSYKGITFYQSSYEPYQEFLVTITNKKTGLSENVIIPYKEQHSFEKNGLRLGIINAEGRGQSVSRIKIWLTDDNGDPSLFWLDDGEQVTVERTKNNYTVSAKQMYATGLQIAKDPGVWTVYTGCALMVLGLIVAFFMSHQRIWLYIREESDGKSSILMTGNANKNKVHFEKIFQTLTQAIKKI
ncbi:MAG: cytochrome c biogenesis protein ResB [Proteobacteria bacterium]|nr:cytochrome c biogenesis protein ResB [Pseudomonadota bacterium]MBU4585841.1 cytochrome c biogenesis protein ResB [Pseudomonadota bacterium]